MLLSLRCLLVLVVLCAPGPFPGAAMAAGQSPAAASTISYTRYELGDPGRGAFRIVFDVTATREGAGRFYNTVRAGSDVTMHGVTELASGRALSWRIVDGAAARLGEHPTARDDQRFIEVVLPRPVPARGGTRLRIDKTYVDRESYLTEGGDVVFRRSLSIPHNTIVLPAGHELVAVNYPSQVDTEADGRIRVSFINPGPAPVALEVRARRLPVRAWQEHVAARQQPQTAASSTGGVLSGYDGTFARTDRSFSDRAAETRTITYFLEQPESGAFRLYHDYTEERAGVDRYLNVVRAGSRVSDPQAFSLDSGRELEVETLRGAEAARRGVLSAAQAESGSEVVVVHFPAVTAGASTRIRIHETYIDTQRYVRAGDDLVWDRNFGRALNRVVLPQGWFLTASDMPAVVETRSDGRTELSFVNGRADGLQVFLRGRLRLPPVARSLTGELLYARPHPDGAALQRADEALAAAPAIIDALLAAARERDQAFMYDSAVALYDRVIAIAPDDWRGWRFRGHRMLSLRRFAEGAQDLERARGLAPDNFDVAYHLGLAYYLLGRFDDAATEYLRCIALATDNGARVRAASPAQAAQRGCVRIADVYDTRVAITEWAYRALVRAERHAEAQQLLAEIRPAVQVGANEAYYHTMLVRRGEWPAEELLDPLPESGRFETRAYGVALDALLAGDTERGLFLMRRIAADPHWPGFGRLAAEAELARRSAGSAAPGRR
jgi:tetratricopeptide (TPR) repeat protein